MLYNDSTQVMSAKANDRDLQTKRLKRLLFKEKTGNYSGKRGNENDVSPPNQFCFKYLIKFSSNCLNDYFTSNKF